MKKLQKTLFLLFVVLAFGTLFACGPSADERERERIEDSIRLEQDRQSLLERANFMLDSIAKAQEDTAIADSLN